MKNTKCTRLISCLIAVLLFVEMVFGPSVPAIYAGTDNGQKQEQNVSSEEPLESNEQGVFEKGEDYTVFAGDSGERTIDVFPSPVRAADDNGELKDIDNSFVISEKDPNTYVNVNGLADVILPTVPSEDAPIKVVSEDRVFSFYPIVEIPETSAVMQAESEGDVGTAAQVEEEPGENSEERKLEADETEENSEESIPQEDDQQDAAGAYSYEQNSDYLPNEADDQEKVIHDVEQIEFDEVIEEKVENLYHDEEIKTTGIRYASPDQDVSFEYYVTDSGIKEDIVLDNPPESNEFVFMINCLGTVPELKYRAIIFNDEETGEETGAIQEPFMTDSSEDERHGYSEDLEYSIEPVDVENGIYKVILKVSRDYLDDPARVYPVTIDPTYTAKTSSSVQSVYVLSKHNTTNYYSSGIRKMCIGYGANDGIARTYIHFPALKNKISGNYVTSATLKLTEYENSSKPANKSQWSI